MVVHLSKDLILGAQVAAAARDAGIVYRSFPTVAAFLDWLSGEDGPGAGDWNNDNTGEVGSKNSGEPLLILVDLQLPGLDAGSLAGAVRSARPDARVIAYAQHVFTDVLDAGSAAGMEVMPRGKFSRKIDDLVKSA